MDPNRPRVPYEVVFSGEGVPEDFNFDSWSKALVAASALVQGATKQAAADAAGIAVGTLYTWTKRDGWATAMALARNEAHDVVIGKARKAMNDLLQEDAPENERGRMARFVLERSDPDYMDTKTRRGLGGGGDGGLDAEVMAELGQLSLDDLRRLVSFLRSGGSLSSLIAALDNVVDVRTEPQSKGRELARKFLEEDG